MSDNQACENTDVELWRGPDEGNGDYYADSIHLTKGGGIGINCGGMVYVKPVRAWHGMAERLADAEADALRLHHEKCDFYERAIVAEIERDQLRAALLVAREAIWYGGDTVRSIATIDAALAIRQGDRP